MQFPITIDQSTMRLIKKWPMQLLVAVCLIATGYLFNWGVSRINKSDAILYKEISKRDSIIYSKDMIINKKDSAVINLYKELLYKSNIIDRITIITDSVVRKETEKPLKKILK